QDQIDAAQEFYDDINAGRVRGYTVRRGQRVRAGWRKALDVVALPFQNNLRASMFRMSTLSTATIAAASWLAYSGGVAASYQTWALAGLGCATLASLACGWRIVRNIATPLDGAAAISRQIAAGNLLVDIDTRQGGEVGNLYFYLDM